MDITTMDDSRMSGREITLDNGIMDGALDRTWYNGW